MLSYHVESCSGSAGKAFRETPGTPCSDSCDRVKGGLLGLCALSALSSSSIRSTSSTSAVVSLESSKVDRTPFKDDTISSGPGGRVLFPSCLSSPPSRYPSASGPLTRILGATRRGGVGEHPSVSLSLLSNPSKVGVRGRFFSVYGTPFARSYPRRDLAGVPLGCGTLPFRTGVFERLAERGEPGGHRGFARYELINCDVEVIGHWSLLIPHHGLEDGHMFLKPDLVPEGEDIALRLLALGLEGNDCRLPNLVVVLADPAQL
ncbi:hypothetical protein VM1G_11329 [Cytospora mali]|uniref:Uncharacterized protein n=1 Tax=Cytospora mali TaxID=578113 RepID=A0A194VMC4_CYTMA|nr:hypothetical protein VM1G_11329 [Valsa mali]